MWSDCKGLFTKKIINLESFLLSSFEERWPKNDHINRFKQLECTTLLVRTFLGLWKLIAEIRQKFWFNLSPKSDLKISLSEREREWEA